VSAGLYANRLRLVITRNAPFSGNSEAFGYCAITKYVRLPRFDGHGLGRKKEGPNNEEGRIGWGNAPAARCSV
jgi:hypothetical protein